MARSLPRLTFLLIASLALAQESPSSAVHRIVARDLAACSNRLLRLGPGSPQDLGLDTRIMELRATQDWPGLRRLIEALPAPERKRRLGPLMEALTQLEAWPALRQAAEEATNLLDRCEGPRPGEPRTSLAQALSGAGRHREACRIHLENAFLGWEPGFRMTCGEARDASDWPLLLEAAEAGLFMRSDRAAFQRFQGEALYRMDRYQEAVLVLRESLDLDPAHSNSWLHLATCYSGMRRYAEAEEAATQAIRQAPDGVGAYLFRAQLRGYLKQFAKAQEDYRMALSLVPQDRVMQKQIQDALASLERYSARGKR